MKNFSFKAVLIVGVVLLGLVCVYWSAFKVGDDVVAEQRAMRKAPKSAVSTEQSAVAVDAPEATDEPNVPTKPDETTGEDSIVAEHWVDAEGKAGRRRVLVVKSAFKYPYVRRLESLRKVGAEVVVDRLSASVADHVIVKLLPDVDAAHVEKALSASGLQLRQMRGNGYALVEVVEPLALDGQKATIARLASMTEIVAYAEPDYIIYPSLEPNDSDYASRMWPLNNTGVTGNSRLGADISAEEGWDIQNSSPNVIVAVADTGMRYTHEDLASNLWVHPSSGIHGIDVYDDDNDPMDVDGHGTHVAGIIGAEGNNGRGITGVSWDVQLMPLRFIGPEGGATSDAIRVIDYARENGARIINLSWGTSDESSALEDAITRCLDANVIIVAAAGNESRNTDDVPYYPSSFPLPNIVSVASTDSNDSLSNFSNFGFSTVDLAAPGAAVWSCGIESDSAYRYMSGTSMAAPHVSGALALAIARFPNDSIDELIQRVWFSVDSVVPSRVASGGRLNLLNLLTNVDSNGPNDNFISPYEVSICQDYWCWYSSQATREADEDGFSPDTGQHSYWFRWVAPEDGLLTFSGQARAGDVSVVAFRGKTKTGLERIADNFRTRPQRNSSLRFYVEEGEEYRFSLDSRSSVRQILAARFSFAPASDMFDNATDLTGSSFTQEVINCGATAEPFELSRPHAGVGIGQSIWARWTADRTGSFTINVGSVNYDSVLAVYTGERDSLVEVASNDDTGPFDTSSEVTFDAIAGTTYHIAIDGFRDGQSGRLLLSGFPAGGLLVYSTPQDTVSTIGERQAFHVGASGSNLQYIWSKDGVPLLWPTDNPELVIRPVIESSLGTYTVEVRSKNQTESFSWELSTPRFAPVVAFEPINPIILEGSVLAISPDITATAPVTYQWFYNGSAIAGATVRELRVEDITASNAGSYHLEATNSEGSVRTRDFQVTVQSGDALEWVRRYPTKDGMGYLGGLSHAGSMYLITEEGYLGYGARVDSLTFRRFLEMRRPHGIGLHGNQLVIYGNETENFVPIPQYNQFLTSIDGENWTHRITDLPTGLPILDFASSGVTATVLIDGNVYYSHNLDEWFPIDKGLSQELEGLEYTNGTFVAMTRNTSEAPYWLSSNDGVNWVEHADATAGIRFRSDTSLDSANGHFFVASSVSTRNLTGYSRSADGVTWLHGIQGLEEPELITFHDGNYVTASGERSADGVTWQDIKPRGGAGGATVLFAHEGEIIRAGYLNRSVISSASIAENPVVESEPGFNQRNYRVHGDFIFDSTGSTMSRNGIDWDDSVFSLNGEDRRVSPLLISHDGDDYWTLAINRGISGTLYKGKEPFAMEQVSVPFRLSNITYNHLEARGDHVLLGGQEFWVSSDKGETWNTVPESSNFVSRALVAATESGFILAKGASALISRDSGLSWQSKSLSFSGHRSNSVLGQIVCQGNEVIILDTEGYLLRSTDDGDTWSRVDLGEAGWIAVDHLGDAIYVLHSDGRVAMTRDRQDFVIDGSLSINGAGTDITAFNGALFSTVRLSDLSHALYQGGVVKETDLRISISGIREGAIYEPGTELDLSWEGNTNLGAFASVQIFLNGEPVPLDSIADENFSITAPSLGLNTLTIVGVSQTGLSESFTVRFFSRSNAMHAVTADSAEEVMDQTRFLGALYIAMEDGRILRTIDGNDWDICMHLPAIPWSMAATDDFITIATEKAIYVSYDGITWEIIAHSGITEEVYDRPLSRPALESSGSVIIADVTFITGHFTENGRDWNPLPVARGANDTTAVYYKGLWISKAFLSAATVSIDGEEEVLASSVLGFDPVVWAITESAMVIASSDRLHRSIDGKTWETVGPEISSPRVMDAIDGYFLLTTINNNQEEYYASADGVSWTIVDRIPDRIINGVWQEGEEYSLDGIEWSSMAPDIDLVATAGIETGSVVDGDPHFLDVSWVFRRDGHPDVPIDFKNIHAPMTNWEYGSFHATRSVVADDGTWYLFQESPAPLMVAERSPSGVWSTPRSITDVPEFICDGLFYAKDARLVYRTSSDLNTWTDHELAVTTTNDLFITDLHKFSDGVYFSTLRNIHKTTDNSTFTTVYNPSIHGGSEPGELFEYQNTIVKVTASSLDELQVLDRATGDWNTPVSNAPGIFSGTSRVFVQNNRLYVVNLGEAHSSEDLIDWKSEYLNVNGRSVRFDEAYTTEAQSTLEYNRISFPQLFTLSSQGDWVAESEIADLEQLATLNGKLIRHGRFSSWIESDDDASVSIEAVECDEVALNSPITITAHISTVYTSAFETRADSVLKLWALPDGINDYQKRIEVAVVPIDGMTIQPDNPLEITRVVQLPDGTAPGNYSIAAEIHRPNMSFDDTPTNNMAVSSESLELEARFLSLEAMGNGFIERDNVNLVYANGALVSMTARAAKGATFSGWSGDSVTGLSQITLRMDSDKQIAANFTSNASLDVSVSGSGTVSGQAPNGLYDVGSNANLRAVPNTGWVFVGWSGAVTNSDPETSILMDGSKTLNAKFEISIENWTALHFAALAADVSVSGEAVDADQDGQSNWHEYLHGSDPLDANSTGRESVSVTADFVSMIFLRNSGAQGGAIVPRGSIDLSDWTAYPVQERILSTNNGVDTVEIRLPREGKARAFIQLNYTSQ